jgi:hypothetical protein
MPTNFLIYMDRGGNMQQLRTEQWVCKTHPYFIRYRSNRPVSYRGPANVVAGNIGKDSVWCYATSKFVPLSNLKQEH